jgi:hypothetical protein
VSALEVSRGARRAALARAALGVTAALFGVATLLEGGTVLFGGPAARAEAGDVVPFVLVFNFGAGFGYVLAGVATLLGKGWASWVARALALGSLAVLAAFAVHALSGGAFEARTVLAMPVRAGFWVVQALLLPRALERRSR